MKKRIFKDNAAHLPEFCKPAGEVLAMLGDKWSLSIIGTLSDRKLRFSELNQAIDGISQRMLTMSLRTLERDGLIARIVHPTVPPRVEYELTERGRSLIGPLRTIGHWASENIADITESRRQFDASEPPGS